jgi:hypothetical protein
MLSNLISEPEAGVYSTRLFLDVVAARILVVLNHVIGVSRTVVLDEVS